MAPRIFEFGTPDRFVAAAVGEPGRRTFYLQARQGTAMLTVGLEKTLLAALTARMADLLELAAIPSDPSERPAAGRDDDPLQQPIAEAFRVGALALAWDAEAARVVIEAQPVDPETEPEGSEGSEREAADLLRVRIDVAAARDFVRRAAGLVAAGRPLCPFCGQALDASGHFCPRLSLN